MAIIHSIPKILKKKYADSYVEENLFVDFPPPWRKSSYQASAKA
jgi:hypothetical protein